jgi:hypothetical protein
MFEYVGNPIKHVYCLPDEMVHVEGFGGEDFGVLELDVTIVA